MCTVGMSEEHRGEIAFNCLWPKTAIWTSAIELITAIISSPHQMIIAQLLFDAAYGLQVVCH